MFCFRCPAGAEEDVFVRLSELSVHRHVDNGIDAGREVDQDVADHVGIFRCRESNQNKNVFNETNKFPTLWTTLIC